MTGSSVVNGLDLLVKETTIFSMTGNATWSRILVLKCFRVIVCHFEN